MVVSPPVRRRPAFKSTSLPCIATMRLCRLPLPARLSTSPRRLDRPRSASRNPLLHHLFFTSSAQMSFLFASPRPSASTSRLLAPVARRMVSQI